MGRKDNFSRPTNNDNRVVYGRFNLRREPKTKPLKKESSVFSYPQRGRGQNGESSN